MHFSSSYPLIHNMEKPKYKENNIGFQFLRHLIIRYLEFLIYDTPYCFAYISAPWYNTKMFCTLDEAMDLSFQILAFL